jgi:hypothetical protein
MTTNEGISENVNKPFSFEKGRFLEILLITYIE